MRWRPTTRKLLTSKMIKGPCGIGKGAAGQLCTSEGYLAVAAKFRVDFHLRQRVYFG